MTLPVLNIEDLLYTIDHDYTLLSRMFDQYCASLDREYKRIGNALDTQDFTTLCSVAHKLEGMLGNFSCPAAIDAAKNFHLASRAGNETQVREAFAALQLRTQELSIALKAQLQSTPQKN